jgi:hypothetical protein
MTTRSKVGLGGELLRPLSSDSERSASQDSRRYTGAADLQETQDPQRDTWSAPCQQPAPSPSEIADLAIKAYWRDDLRDNSDPKGTYHTPMWTFARVVKSCYADGVDPDRVFREVVKPEIARRGGWREVLCTDLPLDEIQCDFDYSWHRIRYRIGEGPLALAHKLAVESPLTLPETDPWHDLPVYVSFVSLSGQLQILRSEDPIFLPRKKRIGELLERSKMQITRYCENAIENGYLEITKDHSFANRRAMEYRFVVDRFPELRESDIPDAEAN